MSPRGSSSDFTSGSEPVGPPLIGALLRVPWEAVQEHMLERLHERGFDDFDAAYLNVFHYPGPHGARPTELADRLRMSKQALNYLLGELGRLGYLERRPDPDDLRSKRIGLTPRGVSAVRVMRDAVAEMESAWAQELGPKRFAQLRSLLLELNEAARRDHSSPRRRSATRSRALDG
jgi:DNA-binding MarR family transcriptional regulator